jgi:hypothetical protein
MRGFPAAFLPLAPSRGKGREKGLYARGHTESSRYRSQNACNSLKNEFPSFLFHNSKV